MALSASELNQIVDGFQANWRSPEDPGLESVLASCGVLVREDRDQLLLRLLQIEVRKRVSGHLTWEKWEELAPAYRDRFPDDLHVVEALAPTQMPSDDTDLELGRLRQDLPQPEEILGDYSLKEPLGEGGMGTVWRAIHRQSGQTVALKRIHPRHYPPVERYQLLQAEAASIADLDHPGIVRLREACLPALDASMSDHELRERLEATGMYLVFEYVAGGRTLADVVAGDRLTTARVVELLRPVVEAVAYAHRRGVYHHDLKPGNILLNEAGEPRVADFGLAHRLGEQDAFSFGGTLPYMAPERLRGDKHVYGKPDAWALGVILYELLTRQRPFSGREEIVDGDFRFRPVDQLNTNADDRLVDLCQQCLQRDVDRRLSVAGLEAALTQGFASDQVDTSPMGREAGRSRSALLLGIGMLIPLVAGTIYGVSQLGGVQELTRDAAKAGAKADRVSQRMQITLEEFVREPRVLIGKLKSHVEDRADQEIARARSEGNDWRKIDIIRKRRDAALANLEHLVTTIREGLTGEPDPIYQEAARILIEVGVQDALDYLEANDSEIKSRIEMLKRRRDAAEQDLRDGLEVWFLKGGIYEANLAWEPALDVYQQIVAATPRWSRAQRDLGRLLQFLGRYPDAERHLKLALDQAEGRDERIETTALLGAVYVAQGRHSEAQTRLLDCVRESERHHGSADPITAAHLSNLAGLLRDMDRLPESELLHRRALAIVRESPDPNGRLSARVLNSLAVLLTARQNLSIAEALLRQALSLDEEHLGPHDQTVAEDLHNLAMLLFDTGRLVQAEPLMRRSLAIDQRIFGPEHPEVAVDLTGLAVIFKATNRVAAAEALYRRTLAIEEKTLGTHHFSVAKTLNKYGLLLQGVRRMEQAEPLYWRALAIDEQSLGVEHRYYARDLNNLGLLLHLTGRLSEAEPLYRRALAIDEASHGPAHPDVAKDLNNLGALYFDLKRYSDGAVCAARTLEILVLFEQGAGHKHPYYDVATRKYTRLLEHLEMRSDEVSKRIAAVHSVRHPLEPIGAKLEQLLGPASSVDSVLTALQNRYRAEGRPPVWFLPKDEPISAHLDELMGPAEPLETALKKAGTIEPNKHNSPIDELPLEKPVMPHLANLLGPARSVQEALDSLDEQYRSEGRGEEWFLPLDQPISPLLNNMLAGGPMSSGQ